jgi:uncharacterized protein YjiS (DUF1127 family)
MPAISHRSDPSQGLLQRLKSGFAALPAGNVLAAFRALGRRIETRRQLRDLAALDPHLLRDIGLTETERWRATGGGPKGALKSKSPDGASQ